jgi:hypothetical protein
MLTEVENKTKPKKSLHVKIEDCAFLDDAKGPNSVPRVFTSMR